MFQEMITVQINHVILIRTLIKLLSAFKRAGVFLY